MFALTGRQRHRANTCNYRQFGLEKSGCDTRYHGIVRYYGIVMGRSPQAPTIIVSFQRIDNHVDIVAHKRNVGIRWSGWFAERFGVDWHNLNAHVGCNLLG